MARAHEPERRRDLASQLLGLERNGAAVLAQNPRGELREIGVVGDEHAVLEAARGAVRALHPPRGVALHLDARLADDLADLPRRTTAVLLDVEVERRAEVALAARRKLDLAFDPGDAKRADVLAVEILADDVPDAVVGQQRVRVQRALLHVVARHRPVLELHGALLRDRALELREPARHLGRVVGVDHLDAHRGVAGRLGETGPT